MRCWLRDVLPGADELTAASSDASFRRYFRTESQGATYIVMDAPPAQEDCAPFVQVAGWLAAHAVAAPRVLAQDLDAGFLLLDDLGSETLLQRVQASPDEESAWYRQAIDLLLDMQQADQASPLPVPAYDEALLLREVDLFPDWYVHQLRQQEWSAADRECWQELRAELLNRVLGQPQGLVHRDYHSRNLMVHSHGHLATIDFQDAVRGARSYDLISLLRDSYHRLSPERARELQRYYFDGAHSRSLLPAELGPEEFAGQCAVMAMQRHLKVVGIFARLWLRDGKRAYLNDIPLTLEYLDEVCAVAGVVHTDWLRSQLTGYTVGDGAVPA